MALSSLRLTGAWREKQEPVWPGEAPMAELLASP